MILKYYFLLLLKYAKVFQLDLRMISFNKVFNYTFAANGHDCCNYY